MTSDGEPVDIPSSARHPERRRRVIAVALGAVVVSSVVALAVTTRSSGRHHRVSVVAASSTTTSVTSTTTSVTSATTVPAHDGSTTEAPCDNCAGTTAPPEPAGDPIPQPGDFTGTVTVRPWLGNDGTRSWDGTVVAGHEIWVTLHYRNITDHVVEPSNGNHNTLAIVCASDLTADGHTNEALIPDGNVIFVTNPAIGPGREGGEGPQRLPTTDADLGTMTCAGVILSPATGPLHVVARITNIEPVSFTVVPAPPPSQPIGVGATSAPPTASTPGAH